MDHGRKSNGSNGFINMEEVENKNLGETIKERRLARGWSITDAAKAAGLHRSYWGRLEQGFYTSPSPPYLLQVAQAIDLPVGELYALAGYEQPDELPTFRPYLRAKYNLPPGAIRELEGYFEFLRNQYGIPKDKPVFPPKEKAKASQPKVQRPAKDFDRRAA
jgi:transcriptional regulator with XRE-family HTH domain